MDRASFFLFTPSRLRTFQPPLVPPPRPCSNFRRAHRYTPFGNAIHIHPAEQHFRERKTPLLPKSQPPRFVPGRSARITAIEAQQARLTCLCVYRLWWAKITAIEAWSRAVNWHCSVPVPSAAHNLEETPSAFFCLRPATAAGPRTLGDDALHARGRAVSLRVSGRSRECQV